MFMRACEETAILLGRHRGTILYKMKKNTERYHRCPTVKMLGVLNKWRSEVGLPEVFVTTRAPYEREAETKWAKVQRLKREQAVARMDAVLAQPMPRPPPLCFDTNEG